MSGECEEIRATKTSPESSPGEKQESSCVSFRSDRSKPLSINFKEGAGSQDRGTQERPDSPLSGCVSCKSDRSKPLSINFKDSSQEIAEKRAESPLPSHVSCKSDRSKPLSINFKEETGSQDGKKKKSKSTASQCVSLKSDQSKPLSVNFNASQERLYCDYKAAVKSTKSEKKITDFLHNIFSDLENKMIVFIKHELEMFKKLLRKENTNYYSEVREDLYSVKESALDMALYFLTLMEHHDVAEALQDSLIGFQQRALKAVLCKRYKRVCEGIAKQGESNILDKIYTDLYITAGGSTQRKEQHEVLRIERQKTSVKPENSQMEQEEQIECRNIFEPLPGEEKEIRTVVTQGVAGIGKSICVQKFVLDWAEGKAYQDIKFIFPLPFRELNRQDQNYSLRDIVYKFFPEAKGMRFTDKHKVMFIFDGLDECRLALKFHENEKQTDAASSASLDTIMTNLIQGNLLPSALVWITTRPAAAAMIPAEYVDRVTEVRGFNDVQKEEYFRKKISDEALATRIIDHIKASRSLFIMCHIPVFCWISATVLEEILKSTDDKEIPQTLTEMYTCFLIFQTVQGDKKYNRRNVADIPWDKDGILSLGKLAFRHLEKNNLIFYAQDLEECGIVADDIKVYSGLCNQETGRFLGTVFSFVHLSIQEFIAALYTFVNLRNKKQNVFRESEENKETNVIDLLKMTVEKALESDKGHLDLFLRFLLGLSLESNQTRIRGLLTDRGSWADCKQDIVSYIKSKLEGNVSSERSINLFYCLKELNDDSLVKEIQNSMNSGRLSEEELSPAQWSALVFVLLTSEEQIEVFELQKFIRSDECFRRLLPIVQQATTALLSECNLTEKSCSALLKVLSSDSNLTKVDLSKNRLEDTGVELLCAGLKSTKCKLETLGLSDCGIGENGYAALAEALKSNLELNLRELDLRGNDPGESGVELLSPLKQDNNSRLETLRLVWNPDAVKAVEFLTERLNKNPLLQKHLDLGGMKLDVSEVKCLSALLEDSHCRPQKLRLKNCGITEHGCSALSAALRSNPAHVRELDLSGNEFGNSGVQKLCALLQDSLCKLQVLRLSDCRITEEGYGDLAGALNSNPSSQLLELDLRGNHPGASGVKQLSDLQEDPHCGLTTLTLVASAEAQDICHYLTRVLKTNPLLQTNLNLRAKIKGEAQTQQLSALLRDPHCTAHKLILTHCDVSPKSCKILSEVLSSEFCSLTELDLSNNRRMKNSGVQELSKALKHQKCRLKILRLSDCRLTGEGYACLAEALTVSQLVELDLRGNDPGASGVKLLTDLQDNPHCKLNTLSLLKSDEAQKAWEWLNSDLGINPLLRKHLDLSSTEPGDREMKQLSALLKDSHCKLQNIRLKGCNLSVKSCSSLAGALRLKWCSVRELDLSNNVLQDSGVTRLSSGLKRLRCKLEVLRLNACDLTEESCSALAEVLKYSQLKELNLNHNNLQDSGVTRLSDGLRNPQCKLEILVLDSCSITDASASTLAEILNSEHCQLTELNLSNNPLQDSGVTQLSEQLNNPQSPLRTMRLCKCGVAAGGSAALAKALGENLSCLSELDLSGNNVGDCGIKQISTLLQSPQCVLHKLGLTDNNIGGEGYACLAEALTVSQLVELDLRGNDPGASGVKLLTDLQDNPHCKLNTLRLLRDAAQDGCNMLRSVLRVEPLLQRELDVSRKVQGDSQVKRLSALLEDSHCRAETLRVIDSHMTNEGLDALAKALSLNPSHLRELELSGNKLGGFGMMEICNVLKNQQFRLLKLGLCKCSLTEADCAALVSAVGLNPSHLSVLDLSENTVGNAGLRQISELLCNRNCALKQLKLKKCSLTQEQCGSLAKTLESNPSSHLEELDLRENYSVSNWNIFKRWWTSTSNSKLIVRILSSEAEAACKALAGLDINPLQQTEMDLSGKILKESEFTALFVILKEPQCRIQKLRLNKSGVTDRRCDGLISALTKNPSHLTELDLSENTLGDSGAEKISSLLKKSSCKLQKLMLSDCAIGDKGYASLTGALKHNSSSDLTELDLRGNKPGAQGGTEIRKLLEYPKLKKLRLLKSVSAQKAYDHLTEVLCINPIAETDLNLSENIHLSEKSKLEQLAALLTDPHCRPEKLQLRGCNLSEKGCSALLTALRSEHSSVKELNLSKNRIRDSGVELISAELKNPRCKLETLRLSECEITEVGYAALAQSLSSSQLKELDLSGNDPGETGFKLLTDKQPRKMKLRVLKSDEAQKACDSLKILLGKNPLLEKELDLSNKKPTNIKLSALLQDPHYRVQKLTLYKKGSISEEDCSSLFSALVVNPLHVIDLNLNGNNPGGTGLKKLCDLLQNFKCKLQKLNLSYSVNGESCTDLLSALCINPSHIRDLDLSWCKLEASGVTKLCDLLKNQECRLEKLLLKKCGITDGDAVALTEARNPHLKVLDLQENKLTHATKNLIASNLKASGGQPEDDKPTFLGQVYNYFTGSKSDEQMSSRTSSTVNTDQREEDQREEDQRDTQQGGSSVYSAGSGVNRAGSSVYSAGSSMNSAGSGVNRAGSSVYSAGSSMNSAGSGVNRAGSSVYSAGSSMNSAGSSVYSAGSGEYSAGSGEYSAGSSVYSAGSGVNRPGSSVYSAGSGEYRPGSSVYSAGSGVNRAGSSMNSAGSSVYSAGSGVNRAGSSMNSAGSSVYSAGSGVNRAGSSMNSAGSSVYSAGSSVDGSYEGRPTNPRNASMQQKRKNTSSSKSHHKKY